MKNFMRADSLVLAGLILLSAIPFAAGVVRVVGLASGAEITPENIRFFTAPLPVVLHIVSASLYCTLGAFQFAPGFRRRNIGWHRSAGRLLILCGLVAAFSGLWMTQFYPLHPHIQNDILYGFRIFFGSAMVLFICLGLAAILRRDVAQHRVWMIRGYAIGQGAGTQALLGLPWILIFGKPSEFTNSLILGACWVINLGVAEWIIRRQRNLSKQVLPQSFNKQGFSNASSK